MKKLAIVLGLASGLAQAAYVVKPKPGIQAFGGEPLGMGLYKTERKLKASQVEYQEEDFQYHVLLGAKKPKPVPTPDEPAPGADPKRSEQWALDKIELPASGLPDASSVIVGVVDTGADLTHPDLKAHLVAGYSAVLGKTPNDDNGHGSHCAGVIAAVSNNSIGMTGISNAKVMPLKFLTSSGAGSLSDAIKAISYGVSHGAKVLSNSWGGGPFSQALSDAISKANEAGVIFVVAAGNEANDNGESPTYPASYDLPNVLSVGASDDTDTMAEFSNFGGTTAIFAPGVDIYSLYKGGKYATLSGTSMATPHVAGAAALYIARHPGSTPAAIKAAIVSTGDDVGLQEPRLNIRKLLR